MTHKANFRSPILAAFLIFATLGTPSLRAQSAPPTQVGATNDTGLQPYTPYSMGVGNVNLTNGNLTLELPLINLPGRAGNSLSLALQYDSKTWMPNYVISGDGSTIVYTWQIERRDLQAGSMGWRLNVPVLVPGGWETDANGNQTGNLPDIAILKDGSKHSLGEIRFGAGQSLDSEDASSLRIDTGGWVVHAKTGAAISFPQLGGYQNNTIDSNGNISSDYLDTLGRSVTVTNTSGYPHLIQYKDSNGVTQTITLNYTTLTLSPTFGLPAQSHGINYVYVTQPPANGQYVVLTSVQLANNMQYTFSYNGYGELTQINFPTSGYAQYTYAAFTHTENYWPQAGLTMQADFREVTSRTVCDGSGTCGTTTYSPSNIYVINGAMNVVEPDGHLTVHNFSQVSPFGDPCDRYFTPRETSSLIYAGGTTSTPLLRTTVTAYNSYTGSACSDHYLPTMITTYLNDVGSTALVKKEEFDYDTYTAHVFYPFGTDPCCQTAQDVSVPIDNVVAHREYDYASGAPGPLIRTTQTDWLKTSAYINNHILDRKTRVAILDSTGAKKSETKYEFDNYTEGLSASGAVNLQSTGNARGNLTAIDRWVAATNSYLETRFQYDDAGNGRKAVDPLGHTTTMSYADSWANNACAPSGGSAAAYLTSITNALTQTTSNKYNSCIGTLASTTDPNNLSTTFSYDLMNRVTQKNLPDGGQVATSYNDVPPISVTTTLKMKINPSQNLVTTRISDGLGRIKQSQLTSDPQGTVYTDTTYDALGRVSTVSNPYRSGTDITNTIGTTTYFYDALDRKCLEVPPDGAQPTGGVCPATQPANDLFTTYLGNTTTVTDQTSKSRKGVTDGLGRLTQVFEDPAGLNYETDYSYDALGNLLTVNQKGGTTDTTKWRTRTFTYDSLSRLLTSNNPEVGSITYKYDSDTNCPSPNSFPTLLVSKTDARGIRICSQYEALNRETVRNYSNGDPTITTAYDQANCLGLSSCANIGHRTSMTDAAGSESWSYDVVDRIHKEQRTTNSITRSATYNLDYAGNITSVVYPTGRTVNYTFDAANRPSTAIDGFNGITYATGFNISPGGTCLANVTCYTPQGTFYALSIGQSSSFTGLNLTHSYNSRLQPNEFKASSTGGNAIDITYGFVDPSTSHNAGHVYSITNNLDPTRSQNFTYDQLNRITSALTTSTYATSPTHCWGETYQFDGVANGAWGNLTQIAATTNPAYTGCSQESGFSTTADGNNHLPIFGYDLSGNTQSDGVVTNYQWDAESQPKSAAGVTYTYDGDGRRVSKVGSKLYWYGSGGDILAETDTSGSTLNEYIFFGGKRVAMLPTGSSPVYYVEDLLGTSRVITTNTGVVCYDADFYPYGGERPYTNTCPQNYKFEGKERDTETGNDDFGARYYSNRFGRWLSADWSSVPAPVPYANLSNPQTLNLYAMVADDPETFADLDGHCCDGDGIGDTIGRFFATAVATWASDNAFGALRPTPTTVEGKLGQAFGDTVAQYTGVSEVEGGTAGLASAPETAMVPEVGPEGAVIQAVGSEAMILHGTATATIATANLAKSALEDTAASKPHGNTAGDQPAELYEKHDANGNFEKHGVSQDASKRYSKKEVNGGTVKVTDRGPRKEMLKKERQKVETNPGPKNKEPWAGKKKDLNQQP